MLLQGFCFESAKTAIIKLHAVTASLYKFECAMYENNTVYAYTMKNVWFVFVVGYYDYTTMLCILNFVNLYNYMPWCMK